MHNTCCVVRKMRSVMRDEDRRGLVPITGAVGTMNLRTWSGEMLRRFIVCAVVVWVIYSRVKPGYVGPTCQKGPCLPPIEVWAAKIDGSSAFMVADATKHGTYEIEVFPVDGSVMVDLGPAEKSHWSADGQQLFYLRRITPGQCAPATIHVYNFATNQDQIVLGPEIVLSPTQHVTLNACDHAFLVSPTEDMVLLVLGGAGSWIVGLH